ncbi:hypothetical protein [Pseudothauera rhizosphaerae]|uniref:hypothetical protein n=1 Tax=Pseudothauera rhizosphaerae TaxID=2565932 RepID=UPI001B3B25E7|nr:hypothetical protein [Pseudothauera rhizosphaerae]
MGEMTTGGAEMGVTQQEGVRIATWLELAVAPEWRRRSCKVRVHALGEKDSGCYALSMDGRWLCTGDAQLTVFKGLDAALHFLKLVRIEDFEPGEDAGIAECSGQRFCLCIGRDNHLSSCPAGCSFQQLNS